MTKKCYLTKIQDGGSRDFKFHQSNIFLRRGWADYHQIWYAGQLVTLRDLVALTFDLLILSHVT